MNRDANMTIMRMLLVMANLSPRILQRKDSLSSLEIQAILPANHVLYIIKSDNSFIYNMMIK